MPLSPLRRLLLSLPALAAGASLAQARRPLVLVNAVYPPFVNPAGHGQGEGMDVEIAREALKRAGYAIRVELVPWKRALLMLEQGLADLTTTISRNSDRDRYLRFTQSYRNGANYQFYTRKGSPLRLTALAGLAGRRLGTVAGFDYPAVITQQSGVLIEPAKDVSAIAQKLVAGRLDYMVVTGIRGAWEIKEANLSALLEKQPFEYAAESFNHLAFSKLRSDETLLAAVRSALDQMARDGSLAAIERRYLRWLDT